MRLLLDNDIDVKLRHDFPKSFAVETARYRGWQPYDNGELLSRAVGDYDALVTLDGSIPFQQNLPAYGLCVVVLKIHAQTRAAFAALVPGIVEALEGMAPGEHAFVVDERRVAGLDVPEGELVVIVRAETRQTVRALTPVPGDAFQR